MLLFILEWLGTIVLILGLLYFTSKKASNPKVRICGLALTNVGCALIGLFSFFIGAYGTMIAQIACIFINSRGIINCRKELKKKTREPNFLTQDKTIEVYGRATEDAKLGNYIKVIIDSPYIRTDTTNPICFGCGKSFPYKKLKNGFCKDCDINKNKWDFGEC